MVQILDCRVSTEGDGERNQIMEGRLLDRKDICLAAPGLEPKFYKKRREKLFSLKAL